MTERPPWAEAVADIIDPESWAFSEDVHLARTRAGHGPVEVYLLSQLPRVSAQVQVDGTESDGMTDAASEGDIPATIRRCYAAALVLSGNIEAALAVLKGGDHD